MTKALVIPFHRYPPYYGDNYLLIWQYFKKQLAIWHDEIDKIYAIDSNDFFPRDGFVPNEKITLISTKNFSHADNLNHVVPYVTEDVVAVMDMDTIVYRKDVFNRVFDMLNHYDVAAYIERPSDGKISRFAPYFFFARMDVLRKTSMKFNEEPPKHLDPLAKLSHELLDAGIKYAELADDRSTIQLQEGGTIMRNFRLGMGPAGTGSYHLRNFNGGIHMIDSYHCEPTQFQDKLERIPLQEMTRIFLWNWLLNEITGYKQSIFDDIYTIVAMKGITKEMWDNYVIEGKKFHPYVFI